MADDRISLKLSHLGYLLTGAAATGAAVGYLLAYLKAIKSPSLSPIELVAINQALNEEKAKKEVLRKLHKVKNLKMLEKLNPTGGKFLHDMNMARQLWTLYDINGDETLQASEALDLFRDLYRQRVRHCKKQGNSLGKDLSAGEEAYVNRMMDKLDENEDGEIEWNEYIKAVESTRTRLDLINKTYSENMPTLKQPSEEKQKASIGRATSFGNEVTINEGKAAVTRSASFGDVLTVDDIVEGKRESKTKSSKTQLKSSFKKSSKQGSKKGYAQFGFA